jgi:hypothetical protein
MMANPSHKGTSFHQVCLPSVPDASSDTAEVVPKKLSPRGLFSAKVCNGIAHILHRYLASV